MNRHILTAVVIGCCLTVGSSDTLAQRNVSRGSSSNSASSHLAITQMLQTLDTNRNGMLDLSETNGRTRVFVQRAGLDPNKAHSIAAIARALSNQNKNDKDKKSSSRSKKDVVRKVPGFGVDVELVGIKDFSPSGEERMSADAMNRKFGASIMSQVDKTMSRYDSDKNGVIDQIEQKRTRWSNPSAEVSDTNKDGGLSRLELAYRYKKREDDSKNRLSGRSSSRTTSKTTSTPTPSNSFPLLIK